MKKKNWTFSFLLTLAFLTTQLTAQTVAISHKSHSGSLKTVPKNEVGGFGESLPTILKVVKINDTMVVKELRYGYANGVFSRDTIINHIHFSRLKLTLEELQKMYPDLEFEGFETKSIKKNAKNPSKKQGQQVKPTKKRLAAATTFGILGIFAVCGLAAVVHYRYTLQQTANA